MENTVYTSQSKDQFVAHSVQSVSAAGRQELKEKMRRAQFQLGSEPSVKDTTYTDQAKSLLGGQKVASQIDANRQVLENNKKSNIAFGSDNSANFLPSEAKQSFTRQEIDPDNRKEAVALKANFKRDNFNLKEGVSYYETSATNKAITG